MCKSAPRSRQITMPAPHRSVFYRPDALPATQPTASKHWRQLSLDVLSANTREQSHFAYSILSFANVNMGNDISVANPAANSNYRQIADSYQCSVPNVRRNHTLTSTILSSNWSTTCADIAISHRFRQVQHSIMMNVTWRRFNQSAKQLIVVSLHYNVEKHRSIL